MKIFRIIDELPSLDGFSTSDALELEGIAANDAFFEVPPAERMAIQEFIRGKMEPLVRAAYVLGARIREQDNHAVNCWEISTKGAPGRRVAVENSKRCSIVEEHLVHSLERDSRPSRISALNLRRQARFLLFQGLRNLARHHLCRPWHIACYQ